MSEIETIKFEGLIGWTNIPPQRPLTDDQDETKTYYTMQVECSKEQYDWLIKKGVSTNTKLRTHEKSGKTMIAVKANRTLRDMDFGELPVVDKYGDKVTKKVGAGSTVIAKVQLIPSNSKHCKYSLRLAAVMVLDLVEVVEEEKDPLADFKFEKKVEVSIDDINPHEQQEAHDLDNQEQDCDDIPF